VALIKRSESDAGVHRAIALDLGDLARRAELMRAAATAEAQRILVEARAERARIMKGAAEEGRAAGHAEGREDGLAEGREAGRAEALAEFRERLATVDSEWAAMVGDFETRRETLLIEGRRAVVELAVAIAERVVHRTVELDPAVVEDQLREVLSLVAAPTTLIVRVHPEDEELVRNVLPGLRERLVGGVHVRLVTDAAVEQGSCTARTLGGAAIDGSVRTQLDRIVRELLPGAESETT
jgi:flagellar biosynthesis/type III secretory pathway protein FliH